MQVYIDLVVGSQCLDERFSGPCGTGISMKALSTCHIISLGINALVQCLFDLRPLTPVMKLLFATSSVGLGHVTRDFYLASHMEWASIEWLTAGPALRYLEARGARILDISYNLMDLSSVVEELFIDGVLKLTLRGMIKAYRVVKDNARVLMGGLDLERYDWIVADEFWEFFFMGSDRVAFISDFLEFKPQRGSMLQRLILPQVNKRMRMAERFKPFIYVGFREGTPNYYGVLYTHGEAPPISEDGPVVINTGGTRVGGRLKRLAEAALSSLGLPHLTIGPLGNFTANPLPLIASSKLVITLGGYGSLVELARLKKRGVIVPLGGDFEQAEHSEAFAGRRGYRILDMGELNEAALRKAISEVLDEEPQPPKLRDGSREISDLIRRYAKGYVSRSQGTS